MRMRLALQNLPIITANTRVTTLSHTHTAFTPSPIHLTLLAARPLHTTMNRPPHNKNPNTTSNPSPSNPVPTTPHVRPGASVSITLKADQRTGRQVQGIVDALLTRGNHPRGIKVRLRDGRVGRVQRMVSAAEGERGEAEVGGPGAGLGRDGEGGGGRRGGFGGRDFRADGYALPLGRGEEEEGGVEASLLDYVVAPGNRRGKGKGRGKKGVRDGAVVDGDAEGDGHGEAASPAVTAHCPVCHVFEGDEVAVQHHVQSHFE